MAMTFKQIYAKTPRLRRLSSMYVKITQLKTGVDRKGKPFAACQSYSTHHVLPTGRVIRLYTKNKYVTMITFLDARMRCRVSCSCPDFTFRSEVALHKKGAAEIEYGNGEAPDIKNPGQRPGACKHLIALYFKIAPKFGA